MILVWSGDLDPLGPAQGGILLSGTKLFDASGPARTAVETGEVGYARFTHGASLHRRVFDAASLTQGI